MPGRDGERPEGVGCSSRPGRGSKTGQGKDPSTGKWGMLQNSASKPNTKDAAAGPGSKVRASSQGLARAWQPRVQWNQVHAWAARRLRADPGLLTSSGNRNPRLNEDRLGSSRSPGIRCSWVPFSHAPSTPLPAPSRPEGCRTNEEVRGGGRKPSPAQCLRRDRPTDPDSGRPPLTAGERSPPARYFPLPNFKRSHQPEPETSCRRARPRARDCGVPERVKKFAGAGRRGGGSARATGAGRAPSAPTGNASGRGGGWIPTPAP